MLILYPKLRGSPGGAEIGGIFWRLNSVLMMYIYPRLELSDLSEDLNLLQNVVSGCIKDIDDAIEKEHFYKLQENLRKLHDIYHTYYSGYLKLLKK